MHHNQWNLYMKTMLQFTLKINTFILSEMHWIFFDLITHLDFDWWQRTTICILKFAQNNKYKHEMIRMLRVHRSSKEVYYKMEQYKIHCEKRKKENKQISINISSIQKTEISQIHEQTRKRIAVFIS